VKLAYEPPAIQKLHGGLMNKFGRNPSFARKVRKAIEGVPIEQLVAEYGSPLFVYSEHKLRKLYRDAYNTFARRYPNVQFGWSYKTNYLNAICAVMHQEGSLAEVVSSMEYEKARALGVPGEQIIFNGPHKPLPALERAVREDAMLHLDHFDEICDVESIADKLGCKPRVGIRLNLDAGIYPLWSRFGFNLESGQALDAVKRIASGGKLTVNGLHCHIGTFVLDPAAYARQVEKMVHFASEIEDEFGWTIEYLDIGGGLPSHSRLKSTYLPPEVSVPPIDEYAEQIGDALYRHLRPGRFPKLVLEAGRALVDEAGYLISTVEAVKRLPDGTRAYVADAGVNLLYTSTWYRFDIEVDRDVSGVNENSVICGPLCMNIDIVDEGLQMPPLKRGTRLIISPVGAYNQTQSQQFIHCRPASVLITPQGEVELIREAEDLTDITRRERLPTHLKLRSGS
jgi:diaminopimelate decarboxylase